MPFDFDSATNRRQSDSRKWHKYTNQTVLPMWIADMDFVSPPAVMTALQQRVEHGVFGYGAPLPSLVESLIAYTERRYGWKIDPAWIVWLPGLVTGLNIAAAAIGEPGDEVLCCTPVYPPFMSAPKNRQRQLVTAAMTSRDGRWAIDFAALEAAVTPRTRQFFLCSPHNPVGRVFDRAELEQLAAFCAKHKLVITSDEIHCDLILDDTPHVPMATVSADAAARTITLMAPSKTYNIPGLGCSYAVIPDAALRRQFESAAAGIMPDVNILGFVAAEACYRDGADWHRDLLTYLRGNRDYLADFVARELPGIAMARCAATYLAWLNVEALKLEKPTAFFEAHGIGFSDGAPFGAAPGSHVRLNFGCPRATLTEACARMKRALAAR